MIIEVHVCWQKNGSKHSKGKVLEPAWAGTAAAAMTFAITSCQLAFEGMLHAADQNRRTCNSQHAEAIEGFCYITAANSIATRYIIDTIEVILSYKIWWSSRLVSSVQGVIWSGVRFHINSALFIYFYIPFKLKVLLLKYKFQICYFKLVQYGLLDYDESYHARGTVFKARGPSDFLPIVVYPLFQIVRQHMVHRF